MHFSYAYSEHLICYNSIKATPHKAHLTALHIIGTGFVRYCPKKGRDRMNRNAENYYEMTIHEMRELLVKRWDTDGVLFTGLRRSCGTYVFDAVMAVLLGGAGSAKPEQKQYLSFFSSGDVTPWKANAGLKANTMKNSNYQQRGFFHFPLVDNKRMKREFTENLTLHEVCCIVEGYPPEFFRSNTQNQKKAPTENFLHTLHKIIEFAWNETGIPMRPITVQKPEQQVAAQLSPEEYELILKHRSKNA